MISNQVISKVLNSKDFSIIEDNQLDETFFDGYEKEFNFLKEYYDKYKGVPDKETFLDKFQDFTIIDVSTDDAYLVHELRTEKLTRELVTMLTKSASFVNDGASENAYEYIENQIKNINTTAGLGGVDIVAESLKRLEVYRDRTKNQKEWFFSTGLPELDSITHGIQRSEEFIILFARINQGKSWILEKMVTSVWSQGYNVGYISPEMAAINIGYRFDTLYKNFDNNALMWGNNLQDDKDYEKYLNKLSKAKNKFIVATMQDFDNRVTVSKLRSWVKKNNLDLLAIDGLKYLTDERGNNRDNLTTRLTNISEDLMSLSVELKIPILAVLQANRAATDSDSGAGRLEMESIRDSDGPAMNASKVFSLRQIKTDGGTPIIEIGIKKQRTGRVGDTIKYAWDINTGDFSWVPSEKDAVPQEMLEEKIQENNDMFGGDEYEVF